MATFNVWNANALVPAASLATVAEMALDEMVLAEMVLAEMVLAEIVVADKMLAEIAMSKVDCASPPSIVEPILALAAIHPVMMRAVIPMAAEEHRSVIDRIMAIGWP